MRCTLFLSLLPAAAFSVCLAACRTLHPPREKPFPPLSTWTNSGFASDLAALLSRIEKGDMKAWHHFASYLDGAPDGEYSETYSMACGELARRDPTIFLRRHLLGDLRALRVGGRAYGAIGPEGRRTMEWLNEARLQLATDTHERRLIREYISALHSVLDSIDRRYR